MEITQLAPALALPVTRGSAQDSWCLHAPPGGMTPFHMSLQSSRSARSNRASVPSQSAPRIAARQRAAAGAFQLAPSAAAALALVMTSDSRFVAQLPLLVPPDASQHPSSNPHHALAYCPGNSAGVGLERSSGALAASCRPPSCPSPLPSLQAVDSDSAATSTSHRLGIGQLYTRSARSDYRPGPPRTVAEHLKAFGKSSGESCLRTTSCAAKWSASPTTPTSVHCASASSRPIATSATSYSGAPSPPPAPPPVTSSGSANISPSSCFLHGALIARILGSANAG